ncbi:MAG: glycosyltransferase family 4 protein [Elusimicrobia bacterium]|nr:glycosyltransferase family 4 protein [Elusimicrobiota bacterium]
MKIFIEEPLHGSGRGGVTVYKRKMATLISGMDPANEYFLFTYCFRKRPEVWARITPAQGAKYKHVHARWPESLVRKLEWGARVPFIESYLKGRGAALYHAHRLPVTKKVPLVTTIYDLFPVIHSNLSPWLGRLFEEIIRPGLSRCERIMAISTHTKRDMIEVWKVPEERIDVVLWGVDRALFSQLPAERLAAVRAQYKLPERFLLMVGPFDAWSDPRPSIEAFAALPAALKDVHLVMAGPRGTCADAAQKRAEELGLGKRMRWLGFVPQPDLAGVYNLAQALLFPSRYEGFGLPVLEAMACGSPVITSTTSCLPEVAGGAALLSDPADVEALRAAMMTVLDDPTARAALKEKGLKRAAEMTWEATARKTWEIYKSVLGR